MAFECYEARILEAEAWTVHAKDRTLEAKARTLETKARTVEAEARNIEAEAALRTLETVSAQYWPREASRPNIPDGITHDYI